MVTSSGELKLSDVALIIPFRDRGTDPLRKQNLDCVMAMWQKAGYLPHVFSDGRKGDEQFNRSAAYNRGVQANPDADVFVFAESDVIVGLSSLAIAIRRAAEKPGLVVPFTTYVSLTPGGSINVRKRREDASTAQRSFTMANGSSVGAINIVSRETMELVGRWDEKFEGSWYDDNAMEQAFQVTCGETRFIEGEGYHLHHQPGWTGGHLTQEDVDATARNKERYQLYLKAVNTEEIRELTEGRK